MKYYDVYYFDIDQNKKVAATVAGKQEAMKTQKELKNAYKLIEFYIEPSKSIN